MGSWKNFFMILFPMYFHMSARTMLGIVWQHVVCEWYDLIPQFTQENWKRLRFNERGISQRQERNLGKHVKHVLFYDVQTDRAVNMMQKLLECNCTEIQSLVFGPCVSETAQEQQTLLLTMLRQLASQQLTHLKLTCHQWNCSITDLLFVCPHLTHFSYYNDHSMKHNNHNYISILSPSEQTSYHNLIYLHVDTESPILKDQVRSIICTASNLRYFIGSSKSILCDGHQISIQPEFVLENCPKLEYYAGDGSYEVGDGSILEAFRKSAGPSLIPASGKSNSNINCVSNDQQEQQQIALHHLFVRSNKNPNQTISLLAKHKDTLRNFRLSKISLPIVRWFDWTDTFQTITMQQLRTFDCDVRVYRRESIITLLNACRSTIQEVQLRNFGNQTLDVPTLVRLQTLPQLRTLSIRRSKFADESSVLTLLRRLPLVETLIFEKTKQLVLSEHAAPLLKNLRHLTIVNTYALQGRNTLTINPGLFQSLAQCGSKLETVKILKYGHNISFPVLHALGSLPLLRSLVAQGTDSTGNPELDEENEEQRMVQFFNGFHRGRGTNTNIEIATSLTTLQNLNVRHVYKLTYTLLSVLSDLTSLQNLCIYLVPKPSLGNEELLLKSEGGCLNLDLGGVLELLRKGRKLRRIVFYGVLSFGKCLPSRCIEKKLVKEQQNDFALRKYIVMPSRSAHRIGDSGLLFKSMIEIINLHYR